MLRDFSEASKQKLLGLVSEVENERKSDFTDWIGDRWYDFEDLIGKLNIRKYINDVNSYHKKVIDKNNATKDSIENIFEKVFNVNNTYSSIISNLNANISRWLDYLDKMIETVTPGNGLFNSKAMENNFNPLLKQISEAELKCIKDDMMQDVEGELEFDEKLIVEYMKRGDLTDEEKSLLDEVLSKMYKYKGKVFWDEFTKEFGLKEILKGSNYIGKIYGFANDIIEGKDIAKTGIGIYEFIQGAAKTYNNYKKIGRAVGTKTSRVWWLKNITGLKSVGRVSTASNPVARFKNNLFNKTSPYNIKTGVKDTIDTFTGKGKTGVKGAIGAWGAVLLNGAINLSGNLNEQKESNGEMSTGRVIAETITETAVDTVMSYGAGIVVGAAVTAICPPLAGVGLLTVAVGGAVTAAVNAGVKAITGKSTSEFISDAILDVGEAVIDKVGNAAKSVKKSIGNWFKKLSFA